jgi:hypothetical protein
MDEYFHRKCGCSRLLGYPVASMSCNRGPVSEDHQTDRLEMVYMGTIARLLFSSPERDYRPSDSKPWGSDLHNVSSEAKVFSRSLLLTTVSRPSVTTIRKGRTITGFQTVESDETFRSETFCEAKSFRGRSSFGSKRNRSYLLCFISMHRVPT